MLKSVASSIICAPHFFEYRTRDDLETGAIKVEEWGLFKFWQYRVVYYSFIDPTLR